MALLQKLKSTIELYNDELIWYGNVEVTSFKRKHKYSRKLLALSIYRFSIFTKNLGGKYALSKDYPLLFLKTVTKEDSEEACFEFDFPKSKNTFTLVVKTKDIDEILSKVYINYKKITVGWSDYVSCNFTSVLNYAHEKKLTTFDVIFDLAGVQGLINTLRAYSNLNGKELRLELIDFLEVCQYQGCTDLVLTECPGIERKSPLFFDLPTLAYALRYNSYFKSIELRNVEHREAILSIALILIGNTTMSRIVCVNSNTEVSEYLGLGLEENPNNNLQILQLNGCKFNSKSIVSFARGLKSLRHCLTVLDISNCLLGSGLNNIIDALSMNWGMTIGLEELNISGNQLPTQVGLRFIAFISNMRKYSRLRRLSVSNTGIDVGMLAIEISCIETLQYLNLSDNKSNKITSGQINYLCETASNLQSIRLASVGLEVETIKRILDALFLNKNLRNINLDLSRNSLGPDGIKALLPSIKMASNLSGLDLSDNDIREKVGVELFKSLPQSIERLYLNRNFGTLQDTSEFCAAFGSFIATHFGLLVLEVAGASGYRLGVGMDKFFGDLGKNGNIQEIDISGNNIGDEGFAELCHHLRTNNGLKVLSVDNNNISHSGYKAFYQLLKYNRSLLYLEYPLLDFKRSVETDKFILILQQIDHLLAMRNSQGLLRAGKPHKLPNPFDFDCLWTTPQNPSQPLFEVPYDLKLITEQLKKDLGEVDDESEPNSATRTPYEPTKRKATLLAGSYMARSLVTTEEKIAEDDFDEETTWAELDNVLTTINAIKEVDPDQYPQTIMEGSPSESPSNSVINVPPLAFGSLPDPDGSQPDSPTRLKKVVTWSKMKSKSAAISSPRKRVGAQRTGTSRLNSVQLDPVDFMDRPEVSPSLTPISHSTFSAVLTPSTPPPPPITDIYSPLPSVAPPPIDLPLSIPLDSHQRVEHSSPTSYPANFPPPPQPFPISFPVTLPTVLPPPEDDFSIDHRIKRN